MFVCCYVFVVVIVLFSMVVGWGWDGYIHIT